MFIGFDYGTSNCAVGIMATPSTAGVCGQATLLPIDGGKSFMPSTLYALERELICEFVGLNIPNQQARERYIEHRGSALAHARSVRREADISPDEQSLFVGCEALTHYLELPGEGYFVKSPKSFLGASGLRQEFVHFFEDIVSAMMQVIKQRAEQSLGKDIQQAVIGRPVNFQGLNADASNRQAIDILTTSAKRAGFKEVEFLFEPLAAGMDFETRLREDKTVLVVDIGGGTSDCAMVRMGPSYRTKAERSADFLGHSGERVGGNDLDIQLAGKHLMPLFGMQSKLKSGLPMPTQPYWNAVSINDVGAQTNFSSLQTKLELEQLHRDAAEPELLERFIHLRNEKRQHDVVRHAEQCKIALSDKLSHLVTFEHIEANLAQDISRQQFATAITRPLSKMVSLMDDAIKQAGCQPDLIYVTGGSAQSPVIRQAIEQKLGAVEVVDGNHFGSVAAGLTVWAERLFR